MTTTNFRHAWVLALGVLSACQLRPDLLEAGDGDSSGDDQFLGDEHIFDDGDTSDDTGDSIGDTSDTGEPEPEELECVLQGTNIAGGTDPEDYLLPEPSDCEVICARGWGHGVPLLESEWTETPDTLWDMVPTRGVLAITPDHRAAMVLSAPNEQYQVNWWTSGATSWEVQSASVIHGEVSDFGISANGIYYYYLWDDGLIRRLTATAEGGDEIFSLELGGQATGLERIEAIEDGVIVVIHDDGASHLMRVDQAGNILFDKSIPMTFQIDVSPSGDVIALLNYSVISWADTQGNFLGDQSIGNADISAWFGLVAIDDTNVVFAGAETEPGFEGGLHRHRGLLAKNGAMGPGWSHSYDRADTWCTEFDAHQTEEMLTGVVQLGDGTLVVTGIESLGHPYGNDLAYTSQPWVAHVTAAGEVLAFDRGFWQGRTVDVVARDNVAYVLLTKDGSEDTFGQPYVRKYEF
jgi:hypothetical protein